MIGNLGFKFRHQISPRKRPGYTLLELMLALGLSVVVLSAIAVSIQVYLLTLTQQQAYIEQQQVARSVLSMVAGDVRAVLQYKAADVSGLEDLAVSQSLIAGLMGGGAAGAATGASSDSGSGDPAQAPSGDGSGTGTGTGTGTGSSGGNGGSGTGSNSTGGAANGANNNSGAPAGNATGSNNQSNDSSSTAASEDSSASAEDTAEYRPLMIGSANQLTIDVSRLPRIDQYNSYLLGLDPQSARPSDLKSIAYFISSAPPQEASAEFDPIVTQLGGLYRRQIDRAVANYRGETEAPATPDEFSKLVAPEVVELGFRYFDGSDWQTSWDSEELQHFPTAIEIEITVDPDRIKNARQSPGQSLTPAAFSGLRQYRLVVHLPAAEVPAEEEEGAAQ